MRFPLSFVGGSAREKEICQRYSAARLRERELQKEEVRACVSPTMYSAVTFRAHNNGPRWWNGTHGFWMGRTAHWTSCSVAHVLRPTLSTSPPSSILHAIFRSVSPHHRDRTADQQLRIPIPTICVHVSPYHSLLGSATFCFDASRRIATTDRNPPHHRYADCCSTGSVYRVCESNIDVRPSTFAFGYYLAIAKHLQRIATTKLNVYMRMERVSDLKNLSCKIKSIEYRSSIPSIQCNSSQVGLKASLKVYRRGKCDLNDRFCNVIWAL